MPHDYPRFSNSLISLENTRYDYRNTSISQYEGEFIWNLIRENQYQKTIEVGCALGISSLYMCDATHQFGDPSHTIIDPKQSSDWSNIGIRNLQALGVDHYTLIEEPSELALPKLLEQNEGYDFAFIDGWHTFDHSLIDFFYMNRMIRVGGMIVFDDANWPSIAKLLRYLCKYPAYKIVLPPRDSNNAGRLGLRQKLKRMFRGWAWFVPNIDPNGFLSKRVFTDWLWRVTLPPVVGLLKTDEDHRKWDWYEPF